MRANIVHIGSNDWFNYKSDIISGLYSALVELGLDILISHNQIPTTGFNIIIGADWVQSRELVDVVQKSPGGFAIFEIEHLMNETINGRTNCDFNLYMDLARAATFIFSPYQLNRAAYEKYGYGDKFVNFKWGFFPEVVDLRYKRKTNKYYTCAFVGLPKGSRRELINSFSKRYGGKFQLVTISDPYCLKDFKLIHSHWALSLKDETDPVQSVNPFRIFHHLANGLPVLGNHKDDPENYSEFVVYQPSESIVEFASQPCAKSRTDLENLARSSLLSENLKPIFGKI
mgnify:CR=1 FL=1